MPQFERYLGIDYSGAKTPTSSLKGLRLYSATSTQPPTEIPPAPSRRTYWTRSGLAKWLADELREGPPTLVGIDGFTIRQLSRIHSETLGGVIWRTYHPTYLRRRHFESCVIAAIQREVAQASSPDKSTQPN